MKNHHDQDIPQSPCKMQLVEAVPGEITVLETGNGFENFISRLEKAINAFKDAVKPMEERGVRSRPPDS